MIIIPAQLESVGTRKDKTLKLTFGTNELSPAQASELFTIANQFGYLAFKDEDGEPLVDKILDTAGRVEKFRQKYGM